MKVYAIKNKATGQYFQLNNRRFGEFVGARVWTKKQVSSWVRNYRFKDNPDVIVEELIIANNDAVEAKIPEKVDIRKVYPFQIILV